MFVNLYSLKCAQGILNDVRILLKHLEDLIGMNLIVLFALFLKDS